MPREIVLDTNVLVAAFRSKRGASYELVRSIGQADWRLNVSVALALEYEDVLKRSGLLQGITEVEIDDFLDYTLPDLRRSHGAILFRPDGPWGFYCGCHCPLAAAAAFATISFVLGGIALAVCVSTCAGVVPCPIPNGKPCLTCGARQSEAVPPQ